VLALTMRSSPPPTLHSAGRAIAPRSCPAGQPRPAAFPRGARRAADQAGPAQADLDPDHRISSCNCIRHCMTMSLQMLSQLHLRLDGQARRMG